MKTKSTKNVIPQVIAGSIQRDNKGRFVPGQPSPNPGGRPVKFEWGRIIREHESIPALINEIFAAALDKEDSRQETAWRILMDKIAPNLKAQQISFEGEDQVGIIIIPGKAKDIKEWQNRK